jgi:hypothetical protein
MYIMERRRGKDDAAGRPERDRIAEGIAARTDSIVLR